MNFGPSERDLRVEAAGALCLKVPRGALKLAQWNVQDEDGLEVWWVGGEH